MSFRMSFMESRDSPPIPCMTSFTVAGSHPSSVVTIQCMLLGNKKTIWVTYSQRGASNRKCKLPSLVAISFVTIFHSP